MNPLRRLAAATEAQAAVRQVSATVNRAALLSEASLSAEAAQAFGINSDSLTITRRQAMTVPAVKRGRNVICGVIASLPLVHLAADGRRMPAGDRPWTEQPEATVPLVTTLTWTLDDLIFQGVAWWRVTQRYADGYPARFERLAPERVMVVRSRDTRRGVDVAEVWVDGTRADDRDLVRFDGPDEGLLANGGRALRTAITLENATARLAKLDVPLGYLRPTDGAQEISTATGSAGLTDAETGEPLDDSEADVLLDTWEEARDTRNTAFLNRAIEYVQTQLDATKIQLNEQREAQAVEVARLLNLEPRYVAAPTGDSNTYATVEGNRRELIDVSLAPFLNPIEQRLSMGDVTPRGQRIRLARAAWLRGDLLSLMQAAQIAKDMGAITADEIRTEYLGLPPQTTEEG